MNLGTSSGSTNQGQDGAWSNMVATTFANASSDGTSKVTTSQFSGDSRSTSTVNSSTNSRSSESFTGTINTDRENRTARNGTAKSDANVTAKGDFKERQQVGDEFPVTQIVEGNWNNTLDLKSNGEVDADHDRVKRSGDINSKSKNKDNFKVERTGAGYTKDELTGENNWNRTVTITDTRLTDDDDITSKYNRTEDLNPEPIPSDPESLVTLKDPAEENDEKDKDSSSSDAKGTLTQREKTTVETWYDRWYDESEDNKDFNKHHDKTTSTYTVHGGEGTTTATTKVEWTKFHVNYDQIDDDDVEWNGLTETGDYNKTFTTGGNEEGDRQSLTITSTMDRTEETHAINSWRYSDEDTIQRSDVDTFTRDKTHEYSRYYASHALGPDGVVAVGGNMNANSTTKRTETEGTRTTTHERAWDDVDYRGNFARQEILEESNTQGAISIAHESGSYSGNPSNYDETGTYAVTTTRYAERLESEDRSWDWLDNEGYTDETWNNRYRLSEVTTKNGSRKPSNELPQETKSSYYRQHHERKTDHYADNQYTSDFRTIETDTLDRRWDELAGQDRDYWEEGTSKKVGIGDGPFWQHPITGEWVNSYSVPDPEGHDPFVYGNPGWITPEITIGVPGEGGESGSLFGVIEFAGSFASEQLSPGLMLLNQAIAGLGVALLGQLNSPDYPRGHHFFIRSLIEKKHAPSNRRRLFRRTWYNFWQAFISSWPPSGLQ
jgi:hypothetical protein